MAKLINRLALIAARLIGYQIVSTQQNPRKAISRNTHRP